jgi:hypothetical protein
MNTDADDVAWPAMPTETEIYIMPDGRIIIADLPAELAPLLAELGAAEPYTLLVQEVSPSIEASPASDDTKTHVYGDQ